MKTLQQRLTQSPTGQFKTFPSGGKNCRVGTCCRYKRRRDLRKVGNERTWSYQVIFKSFPSGAKKQLRRLLLFKFYLSSKQNLPDRSV